MDASRQRRGDPVVESDPVGALAAAVFGFALRPSQRRAVDSVVGGTDTLAVLPTGSGKSAIYQAAGLIRGGLTIVISPLIALQRDQLRSLAAKNHPDGRAINAAEINSGQHVADRRAALAALAEGSLDFVLLGPEQLNNEQTHTALLDGARPVSLIVVDEAHLVSDWGHDFRPEYLRLPETVEALGHPPVLALTATATPPVQADITRQLRMSDPEVIVADFDRPNIALSVRRTRSHLPEAQAVDDRTVEVVLAVETPALVYALTHERCEQIADRLRHDAVRAAAYHAGLPAAARSDVQDRFFAGRLDVVVATSAFGLGIDKPDVRSVVHAGVPGSLDEYYQEVGRAGRDGQPASAVLVYDERTIRIPRLLAARSRIPAESVKAVVDALEACGARTTIAALARSSGAGPHVVQRLVAELLELGIITSDGRDAINPTGQSPSETVERLETAGQQQQAILASRIESARLYAESLHCRRAELLAYFGEQYAPPCGNCDNDTAADPPPVPPVRSLQGTPVHHRLWGAGTLLSRDDHELVVVFDRVGYRHLTPRSLRDGVLTID
jgi:ATP-dependent DNA helicase RecQ